MLPFIIFALMNLVNSGYARIMFDDPAGRKALWLGLGLMAVGTWMIRKIVDIKV
jgi:tight adherence protein B